VNPLQRRDINKLNFNFKGVNMGSIPVPGTYSASRVSAIIGLNDFQTPFNVFQILMEENEPGWNAKHGYTLPEFVDTAATRWGTAFEDAVIKLAEEKEGADIINREEVFTQKESGIILSCHIDGEYDGPTFNEEFRPQNPLHEGKTTNTRAFYSSKTEIEESLDEDGKVLKDFVIKKKWGEPGTSEVPTEYQVQTAVQRICTGTDLVKLSVLVFPKTQQEFEDLGYYIDVPDFDDGQDSYFILDEKNNDNPIDPIDWARVFAQIGNFHQYLLPRHEKLESEIIKAVQEFHENHVLTGLPPRAKNYDDIRRLLSCPQGTIIATDQIKKLATEYSELTRQLGASSPNAVRREKVKIELLNLINETKRDDYINPPTAISIIDPNGGAELVKFGQDKNGKLRFSAKRAR
jgi:hypothetical protein